MSYLARLKQKISGRSPEFEATEVSEAPFVPFVAPDPEQLREIQAMESRRRNVRSALAASPDIRYAIVADDPETDPVILALAIRGVGTCELSIPKANFDPFKLLAVIEANFGGVTWQ